MSLWDPIKAQVQNGISGSYMDVIFELVAHEEIYRVYDRNV